MKTYTLDKAQDTLIGPVGTQDRDKFEWKLQMDLVGKESALKATVKLQNKLPNTIIKVNR